MRHSGAIGAAGRRAYKWLSGGRPRSLRKNLLADYGGHCYFSGAVRENEEVVPVNVSTWVLPSGVTVGR